MENKEVYATRLEPLIATEQAAANKKQNCISKLDVEQVCVCGCNAQPRRPWTCA